MFGARFESLRGLAWRLLSIALVCGAREIAGRIPISLAFPGFFNTAAALWRMTLDGSLPRAFLITLHPLVIGIGISIVFGVGLGVVMGLSREFEWLAAPIFIVMQAAPMAALIPLITFVYGIGLTAKVLAGGGRLRRDVRQHRFYRGVLGGRGRSAGESGGSFSAA